MATRTGAGTLTGAQLAALAVMLDEQRTFRIQQIAELTDPAAAELTAATDADREIADAILTGARTALAEIEAAQRRLADGSYGRCVHCGVPLPIERLEVLPQVAACVSCQRVATS